MRAFELKDRAGDTWVIVIEDLELAREISYDFDLPTIEEIEMDSEVIN